MPTHPLVVGPGLSAAHSILGCHLLQPVINAVKSHIHGRQLGQNLLLESIIIGTPACLNMGRTYSIRIGLIGLLLSPSISHISHISSTRPIWRDLLPHSPHSCRCERNSDERLWELRNTVVPSTLLVRPSNFVSFIVVIASTSKSLCVSSSNSISKYLNSGRSTKSATSSRIPKWAATSKERTYGLNICRSEKNLYRSKSLGSCRGVSGTGGAAGCFCATDFFLLRARICKQLTPKISVG
nr:hypothetical protein Iba_chr02cCG9540 [Ipomoea batatas]